ncbi:MAG: hypothetical protein RR346_11260 [Bacteroidales bacterium]
MKQFRKLTWAVIASMSLFSACSNVDDEDEPADPNKPGTEIPTEGLAEYFYNFEDVTHNADFAKEGWTNEIISGDRKWRGTIFESNGSSNGYIKATAYNSPEGSYESWAISPALDLSKAAKKIVSFKTAAFWNPTWVESTVFETYVIQGENKTKLTHKLPNSESVKYAFIESGEIDLSSYSGIIKIGFRYVAAGGTNNMTWCVDDFSFGKEATKETSVSISYGTTSVKVNEALECEITTTINNPVGTTAISAEGLPAWATLTDNGDGSAIITGTAPAAAEESTVTIKAINNNVESTKTFTLKVTADIVAGQEMVINGGFETWADEAKPTGWNGNFTTGTFAKATDIKHSGNNSFKHTAETSSTRLQQEVSVTAGKKYRISYWYLDNDANAKTRIWSTFAAGSSAIKDQYEKLQPAKYSEDSAEWVKVEAEITAPATATVFRFEVRTYISGEVGGDIYYDDFSMIEI